MMAHPPALPWAHYVDGGDSVAFYSSRGSGVGCAPRPCGFRSAPMVDPTRGRGRARGAGDTADPRRGAAGSDGVVGGYTHASDSSVGFRRRLQSGTAVSSCDVRGLGRRSGCGRGGMRTPVSPSTVSGPPGDGRGQIDAVVTSETVRRHHGHGGVRASTSPGTVSGPSWDEARGEGVRDSAPTSPYMVSAVGDRSGHSRGSGAAPSWSGVFLADRCQPRMLSMEGGGASDGRHGETRGGGNGERTSTGGMINEQRAAEATGVSDCRPVSSQNRKKRGRTEPCGNVGRGRQRGQLKEQAKTCHGCRNAKSKVASVCGGGREGSEEACKYWLCKSCLRKWRKARVAGGAQESTRHAEEGFVCCIHTKEPQLCIFGRRGYQGTGYRVLDSGADIQHRGIKEKERGADSRLTLDICTRADPVYLICS